MAPIRWRWQDTGHVVIVGAALLMAFTRLRGNSLARNLHHVILVVYGGFIAAEMLSQALFVGWARHGAPWKSAPGLVLLAAVALLAPALTRRQIYCHHVCPHGALQQLFMRRLGWQWSPSGALARILASIPIVLLIVALLAGIGAMAIDLNRIEPFDAYLVSIAGGATASIAIGGLLWSLVTPMAYCRYGCPTGALFKLVRFTGDAEKFGARDWSALLIVLAVGVYAHAV